MKTAEEYKAMSAKVGMRNSMIRDKVAAIDFDGTICDKTTNLMYPEADIVISWIRRNGYRIIIFSARAVEAVRPEMEKWLKENGVYFDEITNVKPQKIDYLIDDKAIRFEGNWEYIKDFIKDRE